MFEEQNKQTMFNERPSSKQMYFILNIIMAAYLGKLGYFYRLFSYALGQINSNDLTGEDSSFRYR